MIFQFTRTYETYYDCYVEADSLEEAIDTLNNLPDDDLGWEEERDAHDQVIRFRAGTIWTLLNEDGEEVEWGDLQEWNGRLFPG